MDRRLGLVALALGALSLAGALWATRGGPPFPAGALALGSGAAAGGIAGAVWLTTPRGARPPRAAIVGGLAGVAGALLFLAWAVGLA